MPFCFVARVCDCVAVHAANTDYPWHYGPNHLAARHCVFAAGECAAVQRRAHQARRCGCDTAFAVCSHRLRGLRKRLCLAVLPPSGVQKIPSSPVSGGESLQSSPMDKV